LEPAPRVSGPPGPRGKEPSRAISRAPPVVT